ncbi:MAG: hypothetical protein V9G29_19360 [Burkholderiaceae bacterium]
MKTPLSLVLAMASTFAFAQQSGIGAVKVDPNPARGGTGSEDHDFCRRRGAGLLRHGGAF